MYCRGCDYRLDGLEAGLCPECGRPFDPADRRTMRARPMGSRTRQHLLGVGGAVVVAGTAVLGLWWAYSLPYTDHNAALLAHLGIGGVLGIGAALYAGWNRSCFGRVALALVAVGVLWVTFVMGSGKRFDVWQSGPNPPDEAFSDSGMIVVLVLGWVPAGMVVVPAVAVGFFAAFVVGTVKERRAGGGSPR